MKWISTQIIQFYEIFPIFQDNFEMPRKCRNGKHKLEIWISILFENIVVFQFSFMVSGSENLIWKFCGNSVEMENLKEILMDKFAWKISNGKIEFE